MSIATKALANIGGAVVKTIPFQQWGIGDGISGTSTFDRTWFPTQPGSAHNYREDAGDLLQNSVVAAGVSAVGQALGEAPPQLEERQGDDWVKVNDADCIHLLNNPNGYYTMNHLWISQAGSEITNGEGFWRIAMNGANQPSEIWWERPDMVRIIGDKGAFIDNYELMVNGIPYPVQAAANFKKVKATDYMIHFRAALNHYNPRTGWSPLQAGYRQVVGDNAATTYHTALMRNVTAVGLLITLRTQLENGQNVTPDQFDAIKARVNEAAKGEGAGSTVAINLPLDVSRLGLTPDEMALDRLIAYYEYRIASLIGVDVMVLGLGSGTQQKTYANFKEAITDFQERRIVPTKNRQAEELRIQYLPLWGLDPNKYRITWDYSRVPVMQENEDEKHDRIRKDYMAGIPDLYQAATLLGYEADESMKDVRYSGQSNQSMDDNQGDGTMGIENKAWDESKHPRDDDGKFSSGGGIPKGWTIRTKNSLFDADKTIYYPVSPSGEVFGGKQSEEDAIADATRRSNIIKEKRQKNEVSSKEKVVTFSNKRTPDTVLVARFSDDIDADIKRGWSAYQHPNYGGSKKEVEQDAEEMGIINPVIRKVPEGGYAIVHHEGLSSYALSSDSVDSAQSEVSGNASADGSGYGHATVGKIRKMRTIPKNIAGTQRDLHILEVSHVLEEQYEPMINGKSIMPEEPHSHDPAAKAAPPLPEDDPDPFGVAFTQEEIDKLTDVNNEEAVKAAFASATPEMRALLSARQIDNGKDIQEG